ncbi:MAG: hypothetical protein KGJ59_04920 [Bacteroidota bacterium]|nr:hypothetical protein [Bacteroidota bacterium]
MKNIVRYIVLAEIFSMPLFSQANFLFPSVSTRTDTNGASLRFERNLDTYQWNALTRYHEQSENWIVGLSEQYNFSLIRLQQSSLRDEQNFSFNIARKISPAFSLKAKTESFILSDNQSLGISNAGIHSGVAGIEVNPFPGISVSSLAGIRFDKQQQYEDEGAAYELDGRTDTLEYGGYRSRFSFDINQSSIAPRFFRNNDSYAFFRKDFVEGSFDTLNFHWSDTRWDFYIPADTLVQKQFGVSANIQTRGEELLSFVNVLQYGIVRNLTMVVQMSGNSRSIRRAYRYTSLADLNAILYNTSVQESYLDGGVDMSYAGESLLQASFGIHVNERDEKHLLDRIPGVDNNAQINRAEKESRLDNTARRTMLQGLVYSQFSEHDNIVLQSSASLLRYDTPDSLNTDDRDELLMDFALRETHVFNPIVALSLAANATVGHIVYLFKERSANNNWNRIFRFSPEVQYTPSPDFRMFNSFEVLANYTVFDFESLLPSVQSYSYRQFAFMDSSAYDVSSRLGIDMYFYLRLYERGVLHWQEFSERPQQYVEEATFSPQVRYGNLRGMYFAVGFRSFAQNRYRYVETRRVFDGNFFSYGPTMAIIISLSSRSRVELQGWKEFQQYGASRRGLANLSMFVKVLF